MFSVSLQGRTGRDIRNNTPKGHLPGHTKEPEATKQWMRGYGVLTAQPEQCKLCSSALKVSEKKKSYLERASKYSLQVYRVSLSLQ